MAQEQLAAADPLIRIHARQAGRAKRWSTAARLALALALAAVFEVAWHPEHLFDALAWTWWLESGVIARAQLRRERSARAELDALVRRHGELTGSPSRFARPDDAYRTMIDEVRRERLEQEERAARRRAAKAATNVRAKPYPKP